MKLLAWMVAALCDPTGIKGGGWGKGRQMKEGVARGMRDTSKFEEVMMQPRDLDRIPRGTEGGKGEVTHAMKSSGDSDEEGAQGGNGNDDVSLDGNKDDAKKLLAEVSDGE